MLRDIGEQGSDLAQRENIVERDLAAGFIVVKDLKHPFPVAPQRPRPIAVIDREGSAGKANDGHDCSWANLTSRYSERGALLQRSEAA